MLAEDHNYYSRIWEGDKWSFSKSTEEEPPTWSLVDTWQVKPWEVVKGNKKENQTTTPTIPKVIDSRGTSSKGVRNGEGSCRGGKEGRIETLSKDYHKGWCRNQL